MNAPANPASAREDEGVGMAASEVWCRADLHYLAPDAEALGPLNHVAVEIRDGRRVHPPSWQDCGFELHAHESRVGDWNDDGEIAARHYPEVEALARELSGCDVALVSDHVKRNGDRVGRPKEQDPVRLVHSDFAANYEEFVRRSYRGVRGRGAATLARNGIGAEDVEGAARICMMQFWRNLGPAKMDLPLAFCDARTVAPTEAIPFRYTGYVAGGQSFDALAIRAPEQPSDHAWWAFPELTAAEVVVFRTYDTDLVREEKTWFTPHSAFRDPDVDDGKPARFSIELRAACLFL